MSSRTSWSRYPDNKDCCTALCSSRFVAHQEHRHAHRKHRHGQKVLHLSVSELFHFGIISRTFNSAVPTPVIVRTIPVIFAVGFIMLLIIANEIVQREPVMTRYKIHTLLGLAAFMTINCRTPSQTVGKMSDGTVFTAKKTPDIVSKPPVPLLPTISYETAYLIQPRCIPSLGDELGPRELRIGFDIPQYRRARHPSS